jgi:hypothetical protein
MLQLRENDHLKIVYKSYFDIYFLTKTLLFGKYTTAVINEMSQL